MNFLYFFIRAEIKINNDLFIHLNMFDYLTINDEYREIKLLFYGVVINLTVIDKEKNSDLCCSNIKISLEISISRFDEAI